MHRSHFERLAKSLSATYKLIDLLGSGGAAHVYVAEERKTGRRVAIKALREEEATNLCAARFLAEIDIVAQLDHRNIVPLLGSGTADGLPYYVMPFIAGQSLRSQLESRGRLPLREALDICADVSAALDYAHERASFIVTSNPRTSCCTRAVRSSSFRHRVRAGQCRPTEMDDGRCLARHPRLYEPRAGAG